MTKIEITPINNMKLNKCIVYRATKLETFLSKFLPYHLPFINKRKRVMIRNYFRYAYQRRFMSDMTNALKELYAEPLDSIHKNFEWEIEDYEWEVV